MKQKILILILLAFSTTNCATNAKTRWALMGAAAPIGAGIGAATAPEDEKSELHAMTWAAVFVAGAAIIGNLFYSDSKQIKEMDQKIADLKGQNFNLKHPPEFIKLDKKKGKFIFPDGSTKKDDAEYRFRKTNNWLDVGNKRYHYDMMIERVDTKKKKANGQKD